MCLNQKSLKIEKGYRMNYKSFWELKNKQNVKKLPCDTHSKSALFFEWAWETPWPAIRQ